MAKSTAKVHIDYCEVVHRGETLFRYARHPHAEYKLHKVNSITKSILSILVGIALERGELPGLQVPISDYFPEARGGDKQEVTIEHLLSMTPGWEWPEMGDWGGLPKPMIDSPDWIRFILAQPMKYKPGLRMFYDSGSSQLLSAILQSATGMRTSQYAERFLFGPIGIESYRWRADPKGIDIGGFSLELKAPDLTKLGKLMLDRGRWNGQAVIPEDWVADSMIARRHTYDHIGSYGYHWWVMAQDDKPITPAIYFAMGYGGQYLFVVPEYELIVTFASTLYRHTFLPYRLFKKLLGLN